jgi:hypothetical protein
MKSPPFPAGFSAFNQTARELRQASRAGPCLFGLSDAGNWPSRTYFARYRGRIRAYRGHIMTGTTDIINKSDNKLSPIVGPQVLHFMQVPLAARKSQLV